MRKLYIGIDPGKSGGMAAVENDWHNVITMPEDNEGKWKWIQMMVKIGKVLVFIEKQTQPVFYGKKGEPKSTDGAKLYGIAIRLAKLYGEYQSFLSMLTVGGVEYREVSPVEWQSAIVGITKRPNWTKTAWKNILKKKSLELFPDAKVTLKTCDALLIAEYCRRQNVPQKEIFTTSA